MPCIQTIDGISFAMEKPFDFGFLSEYGRVFKVYDDQDSGNICFGTEKDGRRFFLKFAGAPTLRASVSTQEAVCNLQRAMQPYHALQHPALIRPVEEKCVAGGFLAVFPWEETECMGRQYPASHKRFMALPAEEKLRIFDTIGDFLAYTAEQKYTAIDFYDGSILYDFTAKKTWICDIDFFRPQPCTNDMGRMWGSSRFMSPEEYELGAALDEVTNVYTLGAMAFALFADSDRSRDSWPLNDALYNAACTATQNDRSLRQQSILEFRKDWKTAQE